MANYDALGFNAGKLKKIGADDALESAGGLIVKDSGTIGSASDPDAITIAADGDVTFSQDVVITNNLTVNGTTTTVNSTTVSIADPVFELGDSTTDDNLDRGIKMKYNSSGAKIAFMGLDDSDGKFVMIADATDSSSVFSGSVATLKANLEGTVPEASVTAHEAALTITESQISDLQSYLTAEVNDLTASVTWANVPDANITSSSVTQHEGALTITESQISDLGSYLTEVTYNDFATGLVDTALDLVSGSHDTIASAKAIKEYVDGKQANTWDTGLNAGSGGVLQGDILVIDGSGTLSAASDNSADYVIGVAVQNVSSGSPVAVYREGQILQVGSFGGTPSVGDPIFLDTDGQTLTATAPTSGEVIRLGTAVNVGSGTEKLLYKVQHIMSN